MFEIFKSKKAISNTNLKSLSFIFLIYSLILKNIRLILTNVLN